jgi:hypothetical protein
LGVLVEIEHTGAAGSGAGCLSPEMPGITDPSSDFRPSIDANVFRQRRFRLFVDHIERQFPGKPRIRLLDIGGTRGFWLGVRDLWRHLPLDITIVNLHGATLDDPPFHIRGGNGCDLSYYPDRRFDVVHSNSVIEHVGGWKNIAAMAKEIRRLAPNYFVQTPDFWFPLEPHYRMLFFHWYPQIVRARLLMRKKRGFRARQPDLNAAMANIRSVKLLTAGQMRTLFPDGRLVRERFFGLSKSLVMIR